MKNKQTNKQTNNNKKGALLYSLRKVISEQSSISFFLYTKGGYSGSVTNAVLKKKKKKKKEKNKLIKF